ncbi:MAG: hypothetical protein ACK54F_03845 [Planctomycetia bacterium]
MRTRFIMGIGLACLGATAIAAGDKPSKQERGPRSHIQPVAEIAAQSAAPWAGLVTARAPAVLREQLELKHGAGLIVEEVAAGSAAERAGLRQHDVLVALDGQLLVLPEQLTTLLEEWGNDEPLTCRLLRGGKPIEVNVRPRVAATMAKSSVSGAKSEPMETAGSTVVSATAQSAVLKPAASVVAMLPKKAAARAPTAIATQASAGGKPERTMLTSTVVQLEDGSLLQKDADYSIKLSAGTDAILVVKDARGRIVFNNRIATPEQRSFMPPDVLARVEGLERLQARRRAIAPPVVTEQPGSQTRPERIGSLGIEPVKVR